ncbi:MAG: M1 family metallopeptidase [Candidatus Sungbacteria bacterium]|uniref:Aminopeptidase n=1 Tax=Candidatus Sungiibacteriota bacterium TaxID=2750080 RepID=A0A9D6LT78_9BACT|nr:M1 family metallopeptidase [Candidatus Sungbacteria bacterium]
MPTKAIRLHPGNLIPERYRIRLHPNLQASTFRGEETIYLVLKKLTKRITLHSKDLKLSGVIFRSKNREVKITSVQYDREGEMAHLRFGGLLPAGKAELNLVFAGKLNDSMRGFYRSRYEKNGAAFYMAVSQFEATDARRAFPCIDEPKAKAIFDISLIVADDHVAISNTYETEVRQHSPGFKVIKFAPTPMMSTYLVAFIIGDLEFIETKTKEGVLVRVFTTPGKKHQAKFALDVAAKSLSFYASYFGIEYPLPVLDMIAIPDFAAGAMENWGAVTYRESAILVDPDNSSTANKQWVALVIAHELAHQWFGDLVTMEWWTHLWLNEGFASYIEFLAVDHLFPQWNIWNHFITYDFEAALQSDALKNTHPVEVKVHHPHAISEIFDAVSYQKGAAIIRMLAGYLGAENFRRGLNHYLAKHQYANATTEDLWRAFEHHSQKPVAKIMAGWTGRPGYPLVSVLQKGADLRFRQSRFFRSALARKSSRDKTIWRIPLSFIQNGTKPKHILLENSQAAHVVAKASGWIKLNIGSIGVYRVKYEPENLDLLKPLVRSKKLAPRDRFNLESDIFALAEAGEISAARALSFAESFKKETEYMILADLAANLGLLHQLFYHEHFINDLRAFGRSIFQPLEKKLGWQKKTGEGHETTLLRSLVIAALGVYQDRAAIQKAKRLFYHLVQRKQPIYPDIRGAVYGMVARHGSGKAYTQFLRMYKAANLQEEKNRIARALAMFPNPAWIERSLEFAFSKGVRPQDTAFFFGPACMNPEGREMAWKFMQNRWPTILDRYGEGGHMLPAFIKPLKVFHTKEKAAEVRAFFKTHKAPGGERTVQQVLEEIESNADWLMRDREELRNWFLSRRG